MRSHLSLIIVLLAILITCIPQACGMMYLNLGNISLLRQLDAPLPIETHKSYESIEFLQKSISVYPDNYLPYRALGMAYMVQGNPLLASQALEAVGRQSFTEAEFDGLSNFRLGKAYLAQGNLEEAVTVLQKVPLVDSYFLLQAQQFIQAGNLDLADQALQTAVQIAPQKPDGWYELALLYRYTDEAKTVSAINRFLELSSPVDSRYHTAWGLLLTSQEKFDDAMREFQKAIAISPDDPDANEGLLRLLLFNKQDYASALDQAIRMLARNPKDMWLHLEIGLAYQGQGNLSEGATWFEKAHALYPEEVTPLIYLAGNYRVRNMPFQATSMLREAIQLAPENLDAHRLLADIYRDNGQFDLAMGEYKQALEISPSDAHSKAELEKLLSGQK